MEEKFRERRICMSTETIIWILFFGALILGAPIFVAFGIAAYVVLIATNTPLAIIPQTIVTGADQFPLIAIPCFVLAGSFMQKGGIALQIIEVVNTLLGRFKGGLGLATIGACMFFAALCGSGPATTAALGSLMIPAMVAKGYEKPFAAGLTASGGTLGILIPPSNPMIIYGVAGNVSVTQLFMAGFIPGIIVGVALMVVVYLVALKKEYVGIDERYTTRMVMAMMWKNKCALFAPVLILGGIYGGIFTPTEASVIAVVYAFLVGWIINRQLNFRMIYESLKETNRIVGSFLLIIGTGTLFARFLALYQVPLKVANLISSISSDWLTVLMLINLLLLFLGMFMDTAATIIILTPILLPLVMKLGVDPVHFGIIIVLTSEIAFLTPPLGVNLFVACSLTNLSLETVAKACLPFIVVLLLMTVLITCVPQISLFLPNLIYGPNR